MENYIVLKQIQLCPHHKPTNKTTHYDGGNELPPTALLKIAQYQDDQGFYLLHFDLNGNELTDTYHDTLENAMAQANWEYRVQPSEWTTAPSDK